ncbi:MAG: Molybdate-binding periplasmic protein ModA [Burkholderia sp.]|jgi:molybdate transport system substrate-binding protein
MKKLLAALALAGLSSAVFAAEIHVAVAANFTGPAKELAPLYEKATGDKVVLSFGSTGAFYAQIKNGAPFDVMLAADAKTPAKMVNEGLGVKGTEFTYAVGKLVLWSAKDGFVKDESVLKSADLKKLAVADAKLAPCGEAAEQTLKSLGLYEQLKPKFVVGNNIGKTFQFVKSENAQAGFVAMSQCTRDGKFTSGSGWVVPQKYYKQIRQDAVILTASKEKDAAARFTKYLKESPEAAKIRASFGYDTAK